MSTMWEISDFDAHESVHYFDDPKTGLKAIIALHSTHLGPAAGGTRFWHYADNHAAVKDALRLSRGMSYKNALAGLPLGGGKAVIMADSARNKTPEMLAQFGRSIDMLGGQYYTAEDVGMSDQDMLALSKETQYVAGLPVTNGQVGGDPGPYTARGVYLGVKAAAQYRLGSDTMDGVHVAIQGVGSVGGGLAELLAADGAKLTIADVNQERLNEVAAQLGAQTCGLDEIMNVKADIFSPNALGGILNAQTIANLQVSAVAGGANNQFASEADAQTLFERGILYAPDYVINSGGIINVGMEILGDKTVDQVYEKIDNIPVRLGEIWDESQSEKMPSAQIANKMARRLIGR